MEIIFRFWTAKIRSRVFWYGGKLVFNGNLNKRDTLKTIPVQNTFLQELLEIWSEVNFCDQIRTEQQFLEQPIWHNSLIRIEDKPIFYRQLFLCGMSKITHLMKDSRNFLSLEELINTYKVRVMTLKYFGLISALRHHYNANFPKEPSDTGKPSAFLETFVKSDKGNRVVYKKLLSSKSSAPVKSQTKWKNLIVCDGWIPDWGVAYGLAARCTKSTKLLNFHYRFLHRILPTNVLLTKIGLKQDPNCTFCSNSPESLIHLFWYCMNVETFWENLIERLKESKLVPRNYPKQITVFLGLRPDTSTFSLQLNFCFLLARYYIWCCKTSNKTPRLQSFIMVLKSQFYIESYQTRENSKKWQPLLPILTIN